MNYVETPIDGLWVIELEPHVDVRGSLARTYDRDEFDARGLDPVIAQASTSFNPHAGTLRGMHFQAEPYVEAKLIRCTRGAVHDVALDLRPDSPTYLRWFATELTVGNGRQVYIPAGMAHGFQTLVDDTEVLYHMSAPYSAEHARGVRFDDPAFGIRWPEPAHGERLVSAKDLAYPDHAD
jgi:dTDP-4-dehydrorhamnose 3,5-epimerase